MLGANGDPVAGFEANELYWSSDLSVNQIAEELDLSKGTLYGLITPWPADLSCPECAEELVYPNRTAKQQGLVACPACDWSGGIADAAPLGPEAALRTPFVGPQPTPADSLLGEARTRTVVGGALLGAAAGLALVLWARRR